MNPVPVLANPDLVIVFVFEKLNVKFSQSKNTAFEVNFKRFSNLDKTGGLALSLTKVESDTVPVESEGRFFSSTPVKSLLPLLFLLLPVFSVIVLFDSPKSGSVNDFHRSTNPKLILVENPALLPRSSWRKSFLQL